MPFSLKCSSCGSRLKAKDELAGRSLPCPKCHFLIEVPKSEDDAGLYLLQDEPAKPKPPAAPAPEPEPEPEEPPQPKRKRIDVSTLPPLQSRETPNWLRHFHWVLIFALLPLAFSLLAKDEDNSIGDRIEATIEKLSKQDQERVERTLEQLAAEKRLSLDRIISSFPEERLNGAFLPRTTKAHWFIAFGATVLFLAFCMFLAWDRCANPIAILSVGLFTATLGVSMLLILQSLADWSNGYWVTGRGFLVLLFYILKFIGFSYSAALDSDNGFLLSFFGFTMGVGLCEELCKALPLLFYYRNETEQNWRGAFLWGLASGAGFGIAEGIMYSGNYYNGIYGGSAYVVRFVSCVALHAVWTGSVAIMINGNQDWFQAIDAWYDSIMPVLAVIAVPMVLHGLYDTLLKKDMPGIALIVALASFGFLAFLNSWYHRADDADANEELMREYARRRRAMA